MKPFSDSENLTIERWQELEHTNPHYLAKLLEQRSAEIMPEIYKEAFERGIPVSYGDSECADDEIIEEYKDGRKVVLKVIFDKKSQKFLEKIIREIPKKGY